MTEKIFLKRVHDPVEEGDGTRVLVDRLWPRGVRKADARIDHWLKNVAPSPELRRWFGHDPARWEEFRQHYRAELGAAPGRLATLLDLCEDPPVTLVYAARDREYNHPVVLREFLQERLAAERGLGGSRPCDLSHVRDQFGLDDT